MTVLLSIFPGIGMLDIGFEREGFCVVRGPDPLWGGDIRRFHPPPGGFDGVFGGDPCQSHSALANLVRARGQEPAFPDLSGEYQRVIEEARPRWFLRENVPQAPGVQPKGYDIRTFTLDNSTLDRGDGTGHEQRRLRRCWCGVRDGSCPELRKNIDFALTAHPSTSAPVTGRHEGRVGGPSVDYSPPKRSLEEMCRLQGLPEDFLEHQPWTMAAKRKMIGNGVAIPMAVALAHAIKLTMGEEH